MSGACAVAVGDGRQTLHVYTEDFGEDRCFGLAELRELRCHVCDRAVVLADLHTITNATSGRRKSRFGQSFGNFLRGALPIGGRIPCHRHFGNDLLGTLEGEVLDRCVAADPPQTPHHSAGEVVVGVLEATTTCGGELEMLGRTTPAPLGVTGGCGRDDVARGDHGVEMTAYRGGSDPESF